MNAVISECGKYRYRLVRELGFCGDGQITFVMLNPSTADAANDDPTIRRCIGYGRKYVAARLEVVNLFAYRSTNPDALYTLGRDTAIGPENDQYILNACLRSKLVICAWGNHGTLYGRAKEVMRIIGGVQTPMALKINAKTGQPAHPLYLRGDAKPVMLSATLVKESNV